MWPSLWIIWNAFFVGNATQCRIDFGVASSLDLWTIFSSAFTSVYDPPHVWHFFNNVCTLHMKCTYSVALSASLQSLVSFSSELISAFPSTLSLVYQEHLLGKRNFKNYKRIFYSNKLPIFVQVCQILKDPTIKIVCREMWEQRWIKFVYCSGSVWGFTSKALFPPPLCD